MKAARETGGGMKTVGEVLTISAVYLESKGCVGFRRDLELFMAGVIGCTRLGLYCAFDRPLDQLELDRLRLGLAKLGQGMPLAYVEGAVDFFGARIGVGPGVLIPRQETELLAERVATHIEQRGAHGVLWDVCTGSGCLGISLKKKLPELEVVLSDISPVALDYAKQSAFVNGVAVERLLGDLMAPFGDRQADYMVCNPPYVSEEEYAVLDPSVRDFEPVLALLAGPRGVELYERLACQVKKQLRPGGLVWLELPAHRADEIKKMFTHSGFAATLLFDLASKPRFLELALT